ncbi:BMC domain-containing protein [Lentilactobacillus sp. IMAU92037]|uniref:BMC domain-containing protein n=1 Tax=Lentilactobacillus TaxID=2767893 RepID=UPI001C2C59C3|nr:BMC domain-containing protein [Lentilactobacillus sp. TOM.63]MBV0929578.1 BMC domain-containing protein [Lentilactobacillus dabitei]MDM7515709.1 BMC domain-containing protein [Lentilactobacillus sp. TOM.63]
MEIESLGMIEVRGFLGAVVAADSALKAAEVRLQDLHITRGGLVTVLMTGDVAAVNAGVDAGVSSIEQFNCLISNRVIARLDQQVIGLSQPPTPEKLSQAKPTMNEAQAKLIETNEKPASIRKNVSDTSDDADGATNTKTQSKVDPKWVTDPKALERMRVVDLRKQAYRMEIKTLTKKQIKMGTKRVLIQAILKDLQRRDNI